MEHLADRLGEIPGVVAVTLGGSRATGDERTDSDWDFGLYYRGTVDPADVRALGYEGTVTGPYEWGSIVNGGAWLTVDGERVDLIYREVPEVERWVDAADAGRFEVRREVGYVAGIATYVLAGELATGKVLHGALPRPTYPDALRETAPRWWRNIAGGALAFAESHERRDDHVAIAANLAVAVLAEAQARAAAVGRWELNEKGIVERAGLSAAAASVIGLDVDATRAALAIA